MSEPIEWDFSFNWCIEDFSSYSRKVGDVLNSPVFTIETATKSKWYIELYAKGFDEDRENYISCFLKKSKDNVLEEKTVCVFEVQCAVLEKILSTKKSTRHEFENGGDWGWGKLVEREVVLAEMKKSDSKTLTIRCHIKDLNGSKQHAKTIGARTKILKDKTCFTWPFKVSETVIIAGKRYFCLKDTFYAITIAKPRDVFIINILELIKNSCAIAGKITLLDVLGNDSIMKEDQHIFSNLNKTENWEFPSLITDKQLQDNRNDYVKDGKIILFCEFFVISTTDPDSNHLTCFNVESIFKLSADFQSLLTNRSNTDVKLRVKCGVELQAHRTILAARSPVFCAMFDQEMLENKTGVVNIQDVDADTLGRFLGFLYTGVMDDMDCEAAINLLLVANKYEVSSLKEDCGLYLMSVLSVDNVCKILVLADLVLHDHLKSACVTFIGDHMADVFSSAEYLDWVRENPKLSAEIFLYLSENFEKKS